MKVISTVTALTSALTLCFTAQSLAAVDKRWFEVEVILFSQLGDKTALNESFSGDSNLPRYRKVIDLLTPYLYPETKNLSLQLPDCQSRSYAKPLVISQATLPEFHSLKSLADIAEQPIPTFALDGETTAEPEPELEVKYSNEAEGEQQSIMQNADGQTGASTSYQAAQSDAATTLENTANLVNSIDEQDTSNDVDAQTFDALTQDETLVAELPPEQENAQENVLGNVQEQALVVITEEEQQLISQAALAFNKPELEFNYSTIDTYEQTLCQPIVINENSTLSDFVSYVNLPKPTKYPVEQLNGSVDGNEFVYTDEPYLIDSDSLKLKDITLQLRRSKNFKPMLHLGWRQPLINRRNPAHEPAIRLFAGQHYVEDYQQQLNAFEQQQLFNQLDTQQAISTNDTDEATAVDEINDTELSETAIRINDIHQQLDAQNFTLPSTIAELNSPLLAISNDTAHESSTLIQPEQPNQDWWLDGYFRLHLNHYLFITADFNVAVPYAPSELSEHQAKTHSPFTFKRIPFSQNKRVISTEVHYFDHPYMGMVVQIRRYEKPEPPEVEPEDTSTEM